MILFVDNYDSFVYNLARYFCRLNVDTRVVRNDELSVDDVRQWDVEAIVLSPGPCGPEESGVCVDLVREFYQTLPVFGVCLGHQVIATAFGGSVVKASEPVHGRTSDITHDQTGLFDGLCSPLPVCRYHSLVVDETTLPECLNVDARLDDGTLMGIHHNKYPVYGVQFHPESVLTDSGYDVLRNFLDIVGLTVDESGPTIDQERTREVPVELELPDRPITF